MTSKAASPTFGDVKALNNLTRQLKSQPVKLQFWSLTRPQRIIGFLDGSYRNNEDGFHNEAWQCSYQNRVSDQQKTECHMEVWLCPSQTQKGFPSWFRRLKWCDLYRTENSLDEGSSIWTVHWGQARKGRWGTGGDLSWTKHEERSPLYTCNAYKVQKPSGTDKLVAEQNIVSVEIALLFSTILILLSLRQLFLAVCDMHHTFLQWVQSWRVAPTQFLSSTSFWKWSDVKVSDEEGICPATWRSCFSLRIQTLVFRCTRSMCTLPATRHRLNAITLETSSEPWSAVATMGTMVEIPTVQ